ncbi:MAG: tRNA uridine-5-carboxymethylaminomethyl(34) synthesis GTPase MnmE [Gammaproteobacteria bacterium]|nr:tRNA uridine-5-carboxymethylaminomethyl(34) synthesis GTPase MnmE [Gammaproteobacteria bacterium]
MIDKKQTIAAIATPPGKGGIGIIRLSGPQTLKTLQALGVQNTAARLACFNHFRNSIGETLDQGISIYFPGPESYTGEDVAEIQAHGGQFVLNSILEEILTYGVRLARPGEFTERAFLNGKLDLLQAEAVSDLIESSSTEALQSALRSLNGQFSERIDALLKSVVEIRVFVESALDFPDEEIDFLKESDIQEKLSDVLNSSSALLQSARRGRLFSEGVNIAIIGPPNAGKSSLLNFLARSERAIVTAIPGTTRDTLEDRVVLDGIPVTVVDTAGIRTTSDPIELEGIKRTGQAAKEADLLIYVREAGSYSDADISYDIPIPASTPIVNLYNKIDLQNEPAEIKLSAKNSAVVFLSIKTGSGTGLMKQEIKRLLGLSESAETGLSARTRHVAALNKTQEHLISAQKKLVATKPAAELVAEELLAAQKNIEEITGESTADDLLGKIFSNFCIGK